MGMKLKNIIGYAAAPFTAGASLLMTDLAKNAYNDITGKTSARQQNEAQQALQRETNDLSISLANSAHQREVEDLKKAGLNPVLSAGGQGAATPTLGTAQVQNTMPGGLMGQASQAASIVGTLSAAKQARAQAELTKTQEQLQPAIAQAEIQKNQADATLAMIQAGNQGTKTTAMKNAENLANTWWGRNVSPVLADIGQIFGGAGAVANAASTGSLAHSARINAETNKYNAYNKTNNETIIHYDRKGNAISQTKKIKH